MQKCRVLALLTALWIIGGAVVVAAAESDPQAVALAHRVMAAMGGAEAFDGARLLRFDFAVERDGETLSRFAHWWDRHTGAYRLEGRNAEGVPFRVLFDLESREGEAWRGGERLAGEEATELLDYAYRRFINDSYWLLMPWKWLDDGVRLVHHGAREREGRTFEVVELGFGSGVGLTSGDRYWAFVSPESGVMERWEYLLQQADGSPGEGDPTAWAWEGWQTTRAGVKLATVRRRLGEGPSTVIHFPVAELYPELTPAQVEEHLRPAPQEPIAVP